MSLVFLLCCVIMIIADNKITHRWINITTVLAIPYALIIPVNNLYMVKYGFYEIGDDVMWMLLGGIFCIFIGSNAAHYLQSYRKSATGLHASLKKQNKIEYLKWGPMLHYAWAVIAVTFFRLVYIISKEGVSFLGGEDFSGMLTSGLLGHFLLTSTPLIPVMFYYWLVNKKEKQYLLTALLLVLLFFMTFVKYHVIGIIIATYLLVSFEDHRYLKPGAILLGILATGAFIFNYIVSFFLRGVIGNVSTSFYFQHLWGYISGSLIYDNYIFEKGIRVGTSIFYKLGTFLCSPINLFLNILAGIRLFPHTKQKHLLIGANGERGNIVDAIGYLFPSKGRAMDIFTFCLVMVIIGYVFSVIYNFGSHKSGRKKVFPVLLIYFLTYFVSLSFFGTFYINSVPYEILFWCWFMMLIFDKRTSIYIGSNRIL